MSCHFLAEIKAFTLSAHQVTAVDAILQQVADSLAPACHQRQCKHAVIFDCAHKRSCDMHFSLAQAGLCLQAAAGGAAFGMPITELALLNAFTLLLWQLKAVQQGDSSDRQSGLVDPALGLGERVMSFCLQLESIFEASGDQQRLQDCIFRLQADVFLVFSSDKLDVGLCAWHATQAF